jgi:DNA-binding transcriptional MocR family regulator
MSRTSPTITEGLRRSSGAEQVENAFDRYSRRVGGLRSSAIREILRVVHRPEVISLAGGLPAPELFPSALIARVAGELLTSADRSKALQYGETEGVPELREALARLGPLPAGLLRAENVVVTHGSQQALDLLAKVLIDPGDEVLVETPAYVGALQVFRFFGARVTFVPCDRSGMLPDALAAALGRSPKLCYLTPTFQNPSGTCYPAGRRGEIREVLARSPRTLVVEDDPYREIWFEAPPPPPLVSALDLGRAVYLGTFSKTAVPGLRIGFLLGPPALVRSCVLAKQATDLHTNTFGQHLILRLLEEPEFASHVARVRAAYRARCDVLDGALSARLVDHLDWQRPAGGMFLWARLKSGGNAAELLEVALDEGLAFVPGEEFHAPGEGKDTLRLNFTHCSEGRLAEGVERLARALAAWRTKSAGSVQAECSAAD